MRFPDGRSPVCVPVPFSTGPFSHPAVLPFPLPPGCPAAGCPLSFPFLRQTFRQTTACLPTTGRYCYVPLLFPNCFSPLRIAGVPDGFSVPQSLPGKWSGFQLWGLCLPRAVPPLSSRSFQGIRRCLPDNFPVSSFKVFSLYILVYKLLPFLRFFFLRRRSASFSSSVGATDGMNTPPVPVTSTRLSITEP